MGRALGFLGSMGRGIIAGDGINRPQQAQKEQIGHAARLREDAATGVTGIVLEGPQPRDVDMGGEQQAGQHQNGGGGENDVAGYIGQHGGDLDADMVEDRLHDRDHHDKAHDPAGVGRHADQTAESSLKVEGCAKVDRPQHSDQTQQVQPCGDPADKAVTQNRPPVIKPARRREGRADLSHRQREEARKNAAGNPGDACRGAPDRTCRLRKRIDGPRQNADDRERDGEVGEFGHRARKLLRIAHTVQDFDVLMPFGVRIVVRCHWVTSPCRVLVYGSATFGRPGIRKALILQSVQR